MSATKILWGQVITVFLIVLASVWGATQWTAAALAYQAELGPPWFMLGEWRVYPPPAFFWWWFSPDDEIVMVAGVHPIRAKKARYFRDRRFAERIMAAPKPAVDAARPDDWTGRAAAADPTAVARIVRAQEDAANGGLRREPELPEHVAIATETTPPPAQEFAIIDDEQDDAARLAAVRRRMQGLARQASLDPGDGIEL
jgi:hypothetical protein